MNIVKLEPIEQITLLDDGKFPNSLCPALLYRNVLDIPSLFPATHVKQLFARNDWTNSWDSGIFEYHHYHSTTHKVLGIYSGKTTLQLGGENGPKIKLQKGDVLVIPAGVAHRNIGNENDVGCVSAYPRGRSYDVNYGKPGERPGTDNNISKIPLPTRDPLFGGSKGLIKVWKP